VVPKRLRDELGFVAGTPLDLRAVDGHLEVSVPASEIRLECRDGETVAVAGGDQPTLSAADVRDVLERVRR
jgi:bifunctional DNA-binding transcriptional regulator/antitoxin component of YhaV-PrlF toxin-antitoxin module